MDLRSTPEFPVRRIFILIIFLSFLQFKAYAQNCTVNAGVGYSLCANEELTLDGNQSGSISVNGVWSQVDGPSVIIDNPSDLNSTISGLDVVGGNDLTFRLTATCTDGSLTFQDVTFTIDPITPADAGSDLGTSCPGAGIFTLAANSPGTNETGTWTSSGAGVSIDNPSSATSTITLSGDQSGTAELIWTIVNTNGCSSSDTLTVTNLGGESPVDAGSAIMLDNCYSSTQSTNLSATYGGDGTNGQQGTWTVVNGPNFPTIADVNNNTSAISNLIEGTYTLRWTVVGDCASGTDDVTITVDPASQDITQANAGDFTVFCDGRESTVLQGNIPDFPQETVLWEFVSGPGVPTITDDTSPITQVTGLAGSGTGTYTFRYSINNAATSCSTQDEVSFEYIELPTDLTVNGGDAYLNVTCGATSATVPVSTTGGDNFDVRWQILSGPGVTSEASASGSNINVNNLNDPGEYLLRVRAVSNSSFGGSCPAVEEFVTLVVSEEPTASNPGTAQTLACGVVATSLQGNTPTSGTGTWYQVSGPNDATIVDPTDAETNVSGLIGGTYTFRWLISGGQNCPVEEGEVTVTVSTDPPTTPLAGSPATICANSGYQLGGNDPANTETGTWSVSPSSGITFSDPNDPNALVSGFAASTAYTFTWEIAGCASSLTDDVIITTLSSDGPTAADAGPDQTCLGSNSTTLAGNNPTLGTGTWTLVSGSGTITNAALNSSTVTGLGVGTNVFRWTISGIGGCDDTFDEVTISIEGTPATATISTTADDKCVDSGNTVALEGRALVAGESALWSQTSGPTAVIADINAASTTATFTENGTYTFQYEIDNGCQSTSESITFQLGIQSTTANAGADQSICSPTTGLTLSGNIIAEGTGVWEFMSGPNLPTITDEFSPTTSVTGLTKGTYEFVWRSVPTSNLCTVTEDIVEISVDIEADAGTDQMLCDAESTLLIGNENTNGTWAEVTAHGATITTVPGSPHLAIVSGLTANTDYTFSYSLPATGSCGATSDQVMVEVDGFGTTPNAGVDQELCGALTFSLNADVVSNGTGTWSLVSGPVGSVSFNDANLPNATVSGVSTPGIYIFSWEVVNGTCSFEDQVRIVNYNNEIAAAGADQSGVCSSDVVVSANTPQFGSGSWTESGSNPESNALSSFVNPNPTFLATTAGTYTFTWTIDNGDFCSDTMDDIVISVVSTSPTEAEASDDQNYCLGDADPTIVGNVPTSGTGAWSIQSEPSGASASFDNSASASTTLTNITVAGDYVLRWTISNGSCDDFAETTITAFANPSGVEAGSAQTFCEFDTKVLNANVPTVGTGTWSQISGPNTANIVDPTDENTELSNMSEGTYVFEWSVTNGDACSAVTDQVTITVVDQVAQANAGADQTDNITTTVTLAATAAESGETGTWSIISQPATSSLGTGDFSDINSPTSTFTGLIPGNYVLQWTVDDDTNPGICSTFDQMTITAQPVVSITATVSTSGEDAGSLVYRVSSNGPVASDLTVNFDVSGTADFSDDYSASGTDSFGASSGTLTISSGTSFTDVTINPASDDNIELDETVILTISDTDDYEVGTASDTGTIEDDDDTGIETELSFGRNGVEGGNTMRFVVTLTDGAGTTLTNETGSNFTATFNITGNLPDFDETSFPTSTTISNGNSSRNISLDIEDDLLIEGDETNAATATLTNITHGTLSASVSGTQFSASADIIDDDDDNVAYKIETAQHGVEGGTDISWNVTLVDDVSGATLTNQLGSALTGDIGYNGFDINQFSEGAFTTSFSFANGDDVINLTLDPIVDTSFELDTITATISNPNTVGSITPTINIAEAKAGIDDDATLLIATTQNGAEPATDVIYTVSLFRASDETTVLTNESGSPITVGVGYGGTAVQADIATDFSTVNTASIANTGSSVDITLGIDDDVLIEGDETLTATITSPSSGVTIGSAAVASATISDDDDNTIVLEITATDGDEDGSNVVFVAQLTNGAGVNLINQTGANITADLVFSSSSATDADFTTSIAALETAGISIAPGDGSQTLTLVVDDDLLLEGDETIEATLSNPVGTTLNPTTDSDIATVVDNDDDNVSVRIETSQNGVEGGNDVSFSVVLIDDVSGATLTNALGAAFTGTIGYSNTAEIADFIEASFTTMFSIDDGEEVFDFSYDAIDDNAVEGIEQEELTATISGLNTVATITPGITTANATATISDVSEANLSVTTQGEEDGTVSIVYTVTLDDVNNTGSAITFEFDDLGTGTTTSGDDYGAIPTNAQISVADGASTGTITITVVDDALLEADTETLIAEINTPSNADVTIGTSSATATIEDNDTTTANLSVTTQGEEDGTVSIVYTVTLDDVNNTGSAITFEFDDLGTGTTTSGDDYGAIPTNAQISVADGASTGTITITVVDDALLEADTETLIAEINTPSNADVTIGTSSATATIEDNDTTTANLSVTTQGEEDGTVSIVYTVTLDDVNNTGSAITFEFDDLGTGTATSGDDYGAIPTNAQISVADGASTGTITITVVDDALLEADTETLIAEINTPSNADVTIGTSSATATIEDNDTTTANLSVTTQGEEDGTVSIVYTVTLDDVNNTGSAITFEFDDLGTGTTTSGDDYGAIPTNAQISVADGASTGTITITVVDDALLEADTETLIAEINTPSNTDVTIGTSSATATIEDNDTTTANLSVTTQGEEDGTVSIVYTVTLDDVNNTGSAITFEFDDLGTGTATSGDDYGAIPTNAQISVADGASTGTITITVVDDALLEADTETLIAEINTPSNADVTIGTSSATATIEDNDTTTANLSVTTQGEEDGTVSIVYTVTLDDVNNTGSAITFEFDDLGTGTTTSGDDYGAIPTNAQISVADGASTGTITITVVDDALLEADTETLIAEINTPSNADVTIGTSSATATIEDNDTTTANLSVTTQGEEDGTVSIVYTVTLDDVNNTGSAITFEFDDLGTGTATSGDDYGAIPTNAQISVADGASTGTITITVVDDALLEADTETLIAEINTPSNADVTIGTSSATATIEDNDTTTANLSVTTQGEEDGTVSIVYTVTLDDVNNTGSAITFEFDDLGTGTTTSGDDYGAIPTNAQISVADGASTGTITITVVDDALLEADTETLIAEINTPSNTDVTIGTSSATATIEDNDTTTANLSVTTQGEEDGTVSIVYTVTLDDVNNTGSAITFEFDDLGTGTATSGDDYGAIPTNAQISVADGASTGTITITVVDDALLEADTETLIAEINTPSNADVTIGTSSATATIEDNDTTTANLSVTTQGEEDGTVSIVYTVTLDDVNNTGSAITFEFDDLGTGTTTSGDDYGAIPTNAQISVADGASTGTITITVVDDALLEADTETLIAEINTPSNADVTIGTSSATATIEDNDTTTANLSVTTQGEEDGTVSIVYTVTLDDVNNTGSAITFEFDDLGTGTATSGDDYGAIPTNAQISVADGASTGTITITVVDDALLEADTETLIAEINTPSNADVTIGTSSATATIEENDTTTANLSVTTQGEEDGTVSIVYTVTLDDVNNTGSAITFEFDDLGTGTTTSGDDYGAIPTNAQISVADGASTGTITITVVDDALLEADTETLIAEINTPSNTDVTIGTSSATATIEDNDTTTANLSVTTQGEEDGTVSIVYTVTLDDVNNTGSAITFEFDDLGTGTATSGDDYGAIPTNAQISVADGASTGTITITVVDDDLLEADTETLIAEINTPSNADVTIGTSSATATIEDNDTTTANLSVTTQGEEDGTVSIVYTVTLDDVNNTGSAITFEFDDLGTGTTTSGDDYGAIPTNAQISVADGASTGTITITVVDDALLEADTETLIAEINTPSNADVTIGTSSATATIEDNDTTTANLSVTTQGEEDGTVSIVYTVTLDDVNNTGSAITFEFDDLGTGTATSVDDYGAIPTNAQISVADGASTGTITITVVDDALLEADTETLIAEINTPSNADVTIGTSSATATIEDNDTTTANLSVTTQGEEDGTVSIVYTVTLDDVNNTGSAITFEFDDLGTGTATSGDDYGAIPTNAQISVADGASTGTITITVVDDALLEADTETLIAEINTPSNADVTIGTSSATATIEDNDTTTANLSVTTQGEEDGTVSIVYTVTLDDVNNTGSAITFEFDDLGTGTATSGDDYGAIPTNAQISVADGASTGTITITVVDDALLEADTETLIAEINTPSNADVTIGTSSATATIEDNDTTTANLSVTTQGEEDGTVSIVYTVTLDDVNNTGSAITFEFDDLGTGTTTSGDDYGAIPTNAQISVADGASTGTITITVVDDALLEADTETLIAEINTPSNADVTIGTSSATATIEDNDTTTANLSVTTQGEEDGTVSIVYTVTLDDVNNTGSAITFEFDDLGTGTATSGDDYGAIPTNAQISVADGASTGTITITVVDDALLEADTETLIAEINTPSSADVTIGTSRAIATITDNDNLVAADDSNAINEMDSPVAESDGSGNLLQNDTQVDSYLTLIITEFSALGNSITSDLVDIQGTYGTLNWNEDGTYTYTLNDNAVDSLQLGETVTDTFTYIVSDQQGGTDTADLVITITGINDNPETSPNTNSINEGDDPITEADGDGNLLSNDSDLDEDNLMIIQVSINGMTETSDANDIAGTYGTLDWNSDGSYIYTLNNDAVDSLQVGEVVTETFTYTADDGQGGMITETLVITISGVNDPVVAVNDSNSLSEEDDPINEVDGSGTLLSNDLDPDRDQLVVANIEGETDAGKDIIGTYGTLNWNTDGTYTYTLNAAAVDSLSEGEQVVEVFNYETSDQQGASDSAELRITITGVNDVPVVANDAASTDEGVAVTLAILANDSDLDNELTSGAITLIDPSDPTNTGDASNPLVISGVGTYTINVDGTITFSPEPGFVGTANIEYTVTDTEGAISNVGQIDIEVISTNDGPIASDGTFTVETIDGIRGALEELVTDENSGDELSFALVDGPEIGDLTVNADGSFTYIPIPGFVGEVTFTYEVCDNGSPQGCDQATVTIIVIETDTDGDGINDSDEVGDDLDDPIDTDNDNIPDYLDEDDDGDGINTVDEDVDGDSDPTGDDSDGDGVPNYLDEDDDNDGVNTSDEDVDMDGSPSDDDADNDGTPNYLDIDDDGDGINTVDEDVDEDSDPTDDDSDGDGTPDYLDEDDDGDGINTIDEDLDGDSDPTDDDSDGDGTPDYLDIDDDGDGVDTADEDIDGDGDPGNDDSDGDGTPNYLDEDDDGDSISTIDEDENEDGDPTNDDQDEDGIPDYLDEDDDGDGIPTIDELEGDPDCDGDGIPDHEDPFSCEELPTKLIITPNGDGLNDNLEIVGIDNFPNNVVRVYNRWGNVVWEIRGYDNDDPTRSFSGNANSGIIRNEANLPDGTYYLVINRGDGSPVQKEFVVIKE